MIADPLGWMLPYSSGEDHPDTAQLKARVQHLADMACQIDYLKNYLADATQRDRLAHALCLIHDVVEHYDIAHGYYIYAADDA